MIFGVLEDPRVAHLAQATVYFGRLGPKFSSRNRKDVWYYGMYLVGFHIATTAYQIELRTYYMEESDIT